MHPPATLLLPDKGETATALKLVDKSVLETWMSDQPDRIRENLAAQGFKADAFQTAVLPAGSDGSWSAVLGVASLAELSPWCLARAAESLPEGRYRLEEGSPGLAALGWILGQYVFDRYKSELDKRGPRILLTNEPARIAETVQIAEATRLVRDLVNIPAADLGPSDLETAAADLARDCSASFNTVFGTALEEGYPMIAAVGRAAAGDRAPRLIEIEWGDARHPRIAIIGKGVCFDTGGLDLKPSSAMRIMKKDMGGAAHALGLAYLVMKTRLPVRLHLLIPAVENAVAADAFRPGDVLRSRSGLTVEIDNTDAEGRLVLADALTRAGENQPELIVDFATLTGAARVALGPDLSGLFVNRDDLAADLAMASDAVSDPTWRLPLWQPYREMLASDIADIANGSETPMAGSVTAALFLQKFVPETAAWAHLDTYAWRPAAKPGRPKGGDAIGMRSVWQVLKQRYSSR